MTHLAISLGVTAWAEPVADADYRNPDEAREDA
jgi:hypothetical protein